MPKIWKIWSNDSSSVSWNIFMGIYVRCSLIPKERLWWVAALFINLGLMSLLMHCLRRGIMRICWCSWHIPMASILIVSYWPTSTLLWKIIDQFGIKSFEFCIIFHTDSLISKYYPTLWVVLTFWIVYYLPILL